MRTSDGVDLALFPYGPPEAPVVVAVHGYPDDHRVWDEVAAQLAGDFRVVTYDVRGAGASSAPADPAGYRLDRLAADLAEVIDRASPDRPVHLLAHDWGSIQAWQLVTDPALHPRIASFTSISGPCLQHAGDFLRTAPRGARRRQRLASWYIGLFRLPVLPELLWRSGIAGRRLARREGIPRPSTADAVRGLAIYRAMRAPGRSERRTDVPVQVLVPSADRYVTPALAAHTARFASDLRMREVVGGHWIPRTRPEVVARCVRELAAEVTGGAPVRRTGTGPWAGRTVLVTGAASGIGRAVAEGFARRGARIVAVDQQPTEAPGVNGLAYQVDVADAAAMEALADTVCAEAGVPDVVVNNAGIAVSGAFLDHSAKDWQDILDVNVMGVVHGCRLFGERMRERGEGGHIVNVASAAAFTPTTFLPAYCTTKAAVLMLSECLRAELAPHGIGVTALCPGFLPTNIGASARFVGAADPQAEQEKTDRLLKRRPYKLDKVADAVIRAVERNRPVQLLTVESRVAHALTRVSPGALRRLARYGPGTGAR